MKKQILTLMLLALGLFSKAQQKSETYYKDFSLTKAVDVKKANYKKLEIRETDSTVNIQIFNLLKNCIIKEEFYKNNKPIGLWKNYNENCSLERERDFSKLIYSSKEVDTLFNNVISENNTENYIRAQYGDNEHAFLKYLVSNLKYPNEAIESGIKGTVYLKIIIKADGSVKMFSIISSAHPFLDYESWELIENMPKWNPAKKDGKPIDSYYNIPVKYSLE